MYFKVDVFPALFTMLAGIVFYFSPKNWRPSAHGILLFGGGYLFAITFTEMLPSLFALAHDHHQRAWLGIFIVLGFLFQFILDFFSHGLAHGHSLEGIGRKEILLHTMLASLCAHALLDGVVLVSGDAHEHNTLLIGILLHKLPATFALTALFLIQEKGFLSYVGGLSIFAWATPLGSWITHYLLVENSHLQSWKGSFYALAVGSLLHVASTILSESHQEHTPKLRDTLFVLVGTVIGLSTVLFH